MSDMQHKLLDAQTRRDPHAEGPLVAEIARSMRAEQPRHIPGTPMESLLGKVAFGVCDCWYWTAYVDGLGYGRLGRTLGEVKAHRFAYRLFKGPIPDGLHVMHTCDVRRCVNPDHLRLGTHADNIRDMIEKGRGRSVPQPGEKNPMARLTWPKVAAIRELVASGVTQTAAADRFGVSKMTVSRLVRRETWR